MTSHDPHDPAVNGANTPTDSDPPPGRSAAERRLRRLVVPAPAAYEPSDRIDWIHNPEFPDGAAGHTRS